MCNRLLLSLLMVYFACTGYGQRGGNEPFFTISYFGILGTHPGIKLGVQYPLATLNNAKSPTTLHQIMTAPNIIFYWHRRNQIGASINLEIGYRNKQISKVNTEVMFGLGYLRTKLAGRVYEGSEGQIRVRTCCTGTSHLLKTFSVGLGKNTVEDLHANYWMIRPTLMHLKPYNSGTTLNFAIDAGYHFN